MPPLSHLTSSAHTKSNLYLANYLAPVVSEPELYRLLAFHVPNLMSLLHCLGRTKGSVYARGTCIRYVTTPVFVVRSCYSGFSEMLVREEACILKTEDLTTCCGVSATAPRCIRVEQWQNNDWQRKQK